LKTSKKKWKQKRKGNKKGKVLEGHHLSFERRRRKARTSRKWRMRHSPNQGKLRLHNDYDHIEMEKSVAPFGLDATITMTSFNNNNNNNILSCVLTNRRRRRIMHFLQNLLIP